MKIGYFDCFNGAAGDMLLGALIDAGCPLQQLQNVLAQLKLPGVSLTAKNVQRHGLAATQAGVNLEPELQTEHRHLPEIETIITAAKLDSRVTNNALAVFRRLAEAEAQAHGISTRQVHFHEVGAADAIVDIVCTCAGLELLGIERLECSPIPTGRGSVTCQHGVMPVPAPATARLLQGFPITAGEDEGELTTPTGAALLTSLTSSFGPMPTMTVTAIGTGAGTRISKHRPNLLRLFVGESAELDFSQQDTVTILEAQLDDATGQVLAYTCERLLEAGALEAYIVPIIMKKGRSGQLLTALCSPSEADRLTKLIFAETSTFGVRRHDARREKLARRHELVQTRFGKLRVKIGERGGELVQAWPEYEDCVSAARQSGTPLADIQQETLRNWQQQRNDTKRSPKRK